MVQFKVTMPPELRQLVRDEAKRTDRSESAVIRLALRGYLGQPKAARNA